MDLSTPISKKNMKKLDLMNKKLANGEAPPYIKLPTPSSIDLAIRLFKLCPEQAFPFKIMAETLTREIRGEHAPQLLLNILGQAGQLQ